MTSPFTRTVELEVNGAPFARTINVRRNLADFLRHDLGLTGTHVGCEHGVCGACTVLVDGQPVRSCVTSMSAVVGSEITTLEGLGTLDKPSRLQKAFMDEQAMQCGYCVNGVMMRAKALLDANPKPTETEVRQALDGNLCRCGAQNRMVRAVLRAAKEA